MEPRNYTSLAFWARERRQRPAYSLEADTSRIFLAEPEPELSGSHDSVDEAQDEEPSTSLPNAA
jgi:hypothetical protein